MLQKHYYFFNFSLMFTLLNIVKIDNAAKNKYENRQIWREVLNMKSTKIPTLHNSSFRVL